MKTADLFYEYGLKRYLRGSPVFQGERYDNPSPRARRLVYMRDIRRLIPFNDRMALIRAYRESRDYKESYGRGRKS